MNVETQTTIDGLLAQVQSYREQLEALPSAQRLDAQTIDTVYAMAYQLLDQGQIDKAQSYFSFLMMYAPTQVRVLWGMAYCLKELGQWNDAIPLYALALYIEPTHSELALALAECLVRSGAPDVGRLLLEQMIRITPSLGHQEIVTRAGALLELLQGRSAVVSPSELLSVTG